MLLIASEQASCRLSKRALVKVRNFKFDWSLRSTRGGLFRALSLLQRQAVKVPMALPRVALVNIQGLMTMSSLGMSGEGWETRWWGQVCRSPPPSV